MRIEIIPDDCVRHRRVCIEQEGDDVSIDMMMEFVFSAVIAHGFHEESLHEFLKEYVNDLGDKNQE